MEIATVKAMKVRLEIDLRNAANALIDDFQQATGVTVTMLSIDMLSTRCVGRVLKSYVTGCSVDVEI